MWGPIGRAVAAFTDGDDDARRHFELAATRIQHALLDVVVPDVPKYELGIHAEPARLVGGDYIDLYPCGDDALAFGLGDASGKSLAAALNSLALRSLIRGLIKALGTGDLVEIVTHANDVLVEDTDGASFITFLFGVLEFKSGRLRVVNAGHEPPLILRAAASKVVTLDAHDIVLGITKATAYREEECLLEAGDIAVFYTDGLTEATNNQGEMYTIEGLKAELLRSRHLPASAIADQMFAAVKAYAISPMRDDSTIFVAKRDDVARDLAVAENSIEPV
jgi:sigma-B regulation protein RsbU (phosphoserine phosphatase)